MLSPRRLAAPPGSVAVTRGGEVTQLTDADSDQWVDSRAGVGPERAGGGGSHKRRPASAVESRYRDYSKPTR